LNTRTKNILKIFLRLKAQGLKPKAFFRICHGLKA